MKTQIVKNGCMITNTGILFDLLSPNPNKIFIDDIAHGLANTCRWNGHTNKFWSVAEHCCMMYDNAPKDKKLMYLLHDAEEAYWGDIIKPIKNLIEQKMPELTDQMKELRNMIYIKFGVNLPDESCAEEDFKCLEWEYTFIIGENKADFVQCWSPKRAKKEWLKRFNYEHTR